MTCLATITMTSLAVVFVGMTSLLHPVPKLIWNASASVPIGLYAVKPTGVHHVGDLIVVRPPDELAAFLEARGYLAKGVPLLKHIAALPGQDVCRTGRRITVDGVTVGQALDRDHLGRLLPTWEGCWLVADQEVFLMNWQSVNSLDGRYFGPLPAAAIIGRADPLWTKEGH
ncbi:conjugative transfer signal peptidase TraF [Rhodospirillales bacterium URHD0017]|nr:conjugative transfer signal peptidase TraF [Rhodospirillales bacterium URHD0017]